MCNSEDFFFYILFYFSKIIFIDNFIVFKMSSLKEIFFLTIIGLNIFLILFKILNLLVKILRSYFHFFTYEYLIQTQFAAFMFQV